MLSLGGEKVTPIKKSFGSLPAPRSGYTTSIKVLFAHLLILEYSDHHQNLLNSLLYYPGPLHKIPLQSVYNFLSNVVHRQTDKKTDRQTNATKNITSFAKEIIIIYISSNASVIYWLCIYMTYMAESQKEITSHSEL